MMGLGLGRAPIPDKQTSPVRPLWPLWQKEKITKCSQVDCRDESRVCSDYPVTRSGLGKIGHQRVYTTHWLGGGSTKAL